MKKNKKIERYRLIIQLDEIKIENVDLRHIIIIKTLNDKIIF